MERLLRKNVMVLMALALAFGAWGRLPVQPVAAATYTEGFETDANWTCPSGCNTYADTKTYAEATHPEVVFTAENTLRETAGTQDGFLRTHGDSTYAWRLQNANGSLWQAKITTGGVGNFSFWVRRWDGTPDTNHVVEYSTDNGTTWTSVLTINNSWLEGSSDWKQATGTINTSNGAGDADDIIIRVRRVDGTSERLMIDDFVMTDYPLAVDLTDFSAVWDGEAVTVSWETAQELDNLGFNLYRGESAAGPWVKLNAELIPTQNPGAVFGATYTWLDEGVTPGATYFYRLEDVDIYGVSTFHGPVSTAPVDPSAVALTAFGARGPAFGLPLVLAALGLWGLARKRRS